MFQLASTQYSAALILAGTWTYFHLIKNLLASRTRGFLQQQPMSPESIRTPKFMTHYLLKMMAFMAAFAGIQAALPVHAAVTMSSFQHQVWGNAGQNTYDHTDSSPLSGSVSDHSNRAASSASDWSVNAYRIGNADDANAFAQITYVFRPHSREISILLNGVIGVWWFENKAKMTLINLTSNTLVSSYYSSSYTRINPFPLGMNDMVDYPFSWNTT